MEVNGARKLEQSTGGRSLRNVKSEELIMVEVTRGHGIHVAPAAKKGDSRERDPTMRINET